MAATPTRTRRQPPPFRHVEVARVVPRSPRLVGVTVTGPELAGLDPGLPAASVRLLLPEPGAADVEVPEWNGNEFLTGDGRRPTIRTLTPLRLAGDPPELDVEIVIHGDSPLSAWARQAEPGTPAAVSGTGRGYEVDPDAPAYVLAGDETAIPAISLLLPELPAGIPVDVVIEAASPEAEIDLPERPGTTVRWCLRPEEAPVGEALLAEVRSRPVDAEARVWAAGEAAAVQRLRRHLFDERGLTRAQATVRGYWKHGRAEGGDSS